MRKFGPKFRFECFFIETNARGHATNPPSEALEPLLALESRAELENSLDRS